jgi:hypothetical protein
MPEEVEVAEILQRVIQKTDEGKLGWQRTVNDTTFICVVEGDYTFSIQRFAHEGNDRVAFWMTDNENDEVFRLAGGYGFPLDPGYSLTQLFDKARMAALDIKRKLREAASILDRI